MSTVNRYIRQKHSRSANKIKQNKTVSVYIFPICKTDHLGKPYRLPSRVYSYYGCYGYGLSVFIFSCSFTARWCDFLLPSCFFVLNVVSCDAKSRQTRPRVFRKTYTVPRARCTNGNKYVCDEFSLYAIS